MLIYNINSIIIMDSIADSYIPQTLCISAQITATFITFIRLRDNQFSFPVKQLSPIITASALMCFLLANIVSFVARVIEKEKHYYIHHDSNLQCRTNSHIEMGILGMIFCILRELPLVFFSLKTVRVSLCFWPRFNSREKQKIKGWIIKLFKSEIKLILVCVAYAAIIHLTNLIIIWATVDENLGSYFLYEFFCPSKSFFFQYLVISLRFIIFGIAYLSCLWTYKELDFKKFLIFIFFQNNILTLLNFFLIANGSSYSTYHEFYYGSLFICLFGTLILVYYSGIYDQLKEPPMKGVLYNWSAFTNFDIGMTILCQFSEHLDRTSIQNKNHFFSLTSYIQLDNIRKNNSELKDENYEYIGRVLKHNQLFESKISQKQLEKLKKDCKQKNLPYASLKNIERILSQFCEESIFTEWKKTNSFLHLRKQSEDNANINQKLELFKIRIN